MTSLSTIEIQKQNEYRLGRFIRTEIATETNLITAIIDLCNRYVIRKGHFRATGRVLSATVGVYDRSQEVYVTHLEEQATEVLFCGGTIDTQGEESAVNAKIILADQQGQLTGGHLFSKTIIQEIEIDLQELTEIK